MVAFFGLLIFAALAIKFWYLIVGISGLVAAAYWGRRMADHQAERVEAERRRLAGIVARADQQRAWVMAGDDRGMFGEFPCPPL